MWCKTWREGSFAIGVDTEMAQLTLIVFVKDGNPVARWSSSFKGRTMMAITGVVETWPDIPIKLITIG
jgi:hypothetical protein